MSNANTPLAGSKSVTGTASATQPLCNHIVIDLPIDALQPHPRNARRHSKTQIKQIAASIREFGFTVPVLIDAEKKIIAGHGRVAAAKLAGLTHVPTIEITHLSEADIRAYMLADNRLGDLSDWDPEVLAVELSALAEMPSIVIDVLGFGSAPIKAKTATRKTKSTTPKARAGDKWMLGEHRLICGARHLDQADAIIAAFEASSGEPAVLVATGETSDAVAASAQKAAKLPIACQECFP